MPRSSIVHSFDPHTIPSYNPHNNDACGPGGCGTIQVPENYVGLLQDIHKLVFSFPIPTWGTDLQSAMSSAKNQQGIVMAFFSVSNCSHCQALQNEVFNTPYFGFWLSVHGATRPIILFKSEVASFVHPNDLDQTYHVSGFPTVIGLNSDGSERGRIIGYASGTYIWQWLQSFHDAAKLDQSP